MNNLAICQEIFGDISIEDVLTKVSNYGYNGLELAPFKLAEDIRIIPKEKLKLIKNMAKDLAFDIIAAHWLLVSPKGLHITSPDPMIIHKTKVFFRGLIESSGVLGIKYLVFGSPNQRSIKDEWDFQKSYDRGIQFFREMGDFAKDNEIIIAFEPLGTQITNFGGTIQDGIDLIHIINHPNVKLHLDTNAMMRDPRDIVDIINDIDFNDVIYVHLNDPNNLGPGMGDLDFIPILEAFKKRDYNGWYSIETFDNSVPADKIASESIEYIRKILSNL